jgi:hypothetical protein
MQANVIKHGDGIAIVLDADTVRRLSLRAEVPAEYPSRVRALRVTASDDEAISPDVRAAVERIEKRYEEVFKRLA